MKKILILIIALIPLITFSQIWEGEEIFIDSLNLGDSVVKVVYQDTLPNKKWVRDNFQSITGSGFLRQEDTRDSVHVINSDSVNTTILKADSIKNVILTQYDTNQTDLPYQKASRYYNTIIGGFVSQVNDSEVSLNDGQELWLYGLNDYGTTLTNFTVVYTVGVGDARVFRRAIASDRIIARKQLYVITHDIEAGTKGYATKFGDAGGDASVWSTNDFLYLSAIDSGVLVNAIPMLPNYPVPIAQVKKAGVIGIITVDPQQFNGSETGIASSGIFNGIIIQKQSLFDTIISNVLKLQTNNEENDTIDLTFMYNKLMYQLNTTANTGKDGRASVDLTWGTEAVPIKNYIYIDNTSTPTLTANTTGFPIDGVRFGECSVNDEATHLLYGFPSFQRFNNALNGSTTKGFVSRDAQRHRLNGAKYDTGVDITTSIITDGASKDSVKVSVTSGVVWQFNEQVASALSGNLYKWFNSPTGERYITDLNEIDSTSGGILLHGNNRRFNLDLFYIQNSGGFNDFIGVNSPTNFYSSDANALSDIGGYSVTTVPVQYRGTAIRLCRVPYNYSTGANGTFTNLLGAGNFYDDRGQVLGTGGGGAGSGSVNEDHSDALFNWFNSIDPTKKGTVNLENVTTGTTIELHIPDTSGTIALKEHSVQLIGDSAYIQNGRIDTLQAGVINNIIINTQRKIYQIGDSQTEDWRFPHKLDSLLGDGWETINRGISGNTTGEMALRFISQISSKTDADYCVILGGANDILSGLSAISAIYNLQSMYINASDSGLKVVAVTVNPLGGSGFIDAAKQSKIDSINAFILTAATNVDYVVNSYALLEDPTRPDTLKAAYDNGDGIHLNDSGNYVLALSLFDNVVFTGVKAYSIAELKINGDSARINQDVSTAGIPLFQGLYVKDKLGIGSDFIPASSLHIKNAGGLYTGLKVESTDATQLSMVNLENNLDYVGQLLLTGSAYNQGTAMGENELGYLTNAPGGISFMATDATADIKFVTGGATSSEERMRIDSAGNVDINNSNLHVSDGAGTGVFVGVGTKTQADTKTRFTVYSVSQNSNVRVETDNGGAGAGLQLHSAANIWEIIQSGSGLDGNLGIRNSASGSYDYTFGTNGNLGVGYGLHAPLTRLHIEDPQSSTDITNVAGITGENSNLTTGNNFPFRFTSGANISRMGAIFSSKGVGTEQTELFFTSQTGGVESEAMRINSSGFAGLGTTTPDYKLQVEGAESVIIGVKATAGNAFSLVDRTSTSDLGSFIWRTDGVSKWYVGLGDTDEGYDGTELFIDDIVAGDSPNIVFTAAGNTGLGNIAPAYKLDVTGKGHFTDSLLLDGQLKTDSSISFSGALINRAVVGDGVSDVYHIYKTLVYTIGDPTNTNTDYNFASAANKTEQSIQLGGAAIVPSMANLFNINIVCTENWTGSSGNETGLMDIGRTSGGTEYVANISNINLNQFNPEIGDQGQEFTAQSVYISLTPAINNWDVLTDGIVKIYITFLDYGGL